MIAILVLLLSSSAIGLLAVRSLAPSLERELVAACGMLVGASLPAAALAVLSIAGVDWSLATMAITTLVLATVLLAIGRIGPTVAPARRPVDFRTHELIPLLAIAILLGGYCAYATAGPIAEYDFVGIWGVKGRTFFESNGIDFGFLANPWNVHVHADYPILLPLQFDALALSMGSWDDRLIALIFPFLGLAGLLAFWRFLRDEISEWGSWALLALFPWTISPYLGLGEEPLVVYGSTGVLLARKGLKAKNPRVIGVAGLLLGLAASMKNEGLTLYVAVIVAAVVFTGWRAAIALSSGLLPVVPWLIARTAYGLTTDLTEGDVVSRTMAHMMQPGDYVRAIASYPIGRPLFWAGIAVGLLVTLRALVRNEKFGLSVLAMQYSSYIGAYLITPHGLDWHFRWSWERVINQMTLLLAFFVLIELIKSSRKSDEPTTTLSTSGLH